MEENLEVVSLVPPQGLMQMFCKHLHPGILPDDALKLYQHARGILEDTPIGDPAFEHFVNQVRNYQKLCTYLELLKNPDSLNVAMVLHKRDPEMLEILDVYGIKHAPYMNVRTGLLRVQQQGIVADVYNPDMNNQDREDALTFLIDFRPKVEMVFKPLYFQ